MTGQEVPDNSMPRDNNNNNNRKRPHDGGDANGDAFKRPRTDAGVDDDNNISPGQPSNTLGQETLPSPPTTSSAEESLDNVDVDLDDLETIPDDDVENLEDSLGDVDLTNEDAVVESLGVAEPSPADENNPAGDYHSSNDDDYRHIGSWSQSSQEVIDDDLLVPIPSIERPPPPRRQQQRPRRHLRRWIRRYGGREYFRRAMDNTIHSDEDDI